MFKIYVINAVSKSSNRDQGRWIALNQNVGDLMQDIWNFLHSDPSSPQSKWEIVDTDLPFEISGFESLEMLADLDSIISTYGEDVVTAAFIQREDLESLPYMVRGYLGKAPTYLDFLEIHQLTEDCAGTLKPVSYKGEVYVFSGDLKRGIEELRLDSDSTKQDGI